MLLKTLNSFLGETYSLRGTILTRIGLRGFNKSLNRTYDVNHNLNITLELL